MPTSPSSSAVVRAPASKSSASGVSCAPNLVRRCCTRSSAVERPRAAPPVPGGRALPEEVAKHGPGVERGPPDHAPGLGPGERVSPSAAGWVDAAPHLTGHRLFRVVARTGAPADAARDAGRAVRRSPTGAGYRGGAGPQLSVPGAADG